jgi:Kef-type K+ transport system membrane component KefB
LSTKTSFLAVSFAIVLLPWLLWRIGPVRRVAPLAVVQILVGVLLGPTGLGQIAPELHAALFTRPVLAALDGVSSLGVLLYVFVTALHLDAAALRRDGRTLGAIALGSISVPLLLGAGAGLWMLHSVPGASGPLGNTVAFVAAVAICIAVTALPVLAAVLQEMGLLGTRIGQVALALAALNDAALWVMLAVLLALAGTQDAVSGLFSLSVAVAWFGLVIVIVRPAFARLAAASDQAVLVAGTSLAILSAGVSEALGTGYLIGAFAAGAIMPAMCRTALLGRLEMVTATVLLPFFFMSTGFKALIEPGSASFLGVLAVVVMATVAGKLAGTALPARRAGFSWAESLSLGVMMQTKGLMEVVVLATLHDAGLIGARIFSGMVAMAVVCTVLTAPAVRLCQRLEVQREPGDSIAPKTS